MTTVADHEVVQRTPWRSVALPNEHGGWALTAEPVLLGLLIAPSLAGMWLGVAAVLAFLVRTPLKLMSIDVRHHRWIDRSRLALRVATTELALMLVLAVAAGLLAGWAWAAPVALAAPLVAVEWYFDARSRGRRLIPELAGAAGIAAAAAAIVVAGGGSAALAAGAWLVLASRAVASIPFVRVQIARLRRGAGDLHTSDVAQVSAVLVAVVAVVVDRHLLAGGAAVGVLTAAHLWGVRTPPVPAKRLGLIELGLGLGIVLVTAVGALAA